MDRRDFITTSLTGSLVAAAPLLAMAASAKEPEKNCELWKSGPILVTGGTSGLGKALVLEACRRGAQVAFCGRNEDRGETIAADAKKLGGEALFVKADVRSESDVKKFVSATVKKFGRIDLAVNNAGIEFESESFASDPIGKHLDVINTNLVGVMLCMRYELEQMVGQKKGVIVNMGSTASIKGNAYLPSYSASKHGILGLTRSLAKRYAKDNIRINAVSPYVLDHQLGTLRDRVEPKGAFEREFAPKLPTGRLVSVDEVVRNIFWLGSESALSLTGQNIVLDGSTFS